MDVPHSGRIDYGYNHTRMIGFCKPGDEVIDQFLKKTKINRDLTVY